MHAARMLTLCPLALTLLALCAGCHRPAAPSPVSGKVTYKGAALSNGVIAFAPDASRGTSGRVALGAIRPDGSYTLATDDAAGLPAGWYRVTVAAFATPPDRAQPPAPLLPERYRDPQRSLLVCEVKAERANTIDFNLD